MIVFVHIGQQIYDTSYTFAFFDTVTDKFMEFNGAQVFANKAEFRIFAKDTVYYERCKGLMPNT